MKCLFPRLWPGIMFQPLLACLLILVMPHHAQCQAAQRSGSFTANGRVINVDTFNLEILDMMHDIKVPGMSLAIIDNNRIVFYNAYGVRKIEDHNKVTKRTVFDGCSLSKTLLAYVTYQLADEGKIQLDTPMYRYLEYAPLAHDRRYKLISPRMVLSHSSGIENWAEYNNSDTMEILNPPGSKYLYSGEGYQYLARVVEKILHQLYEEYVNERVIKPLALKNTYLEYKRPRIKLFHKIKPWNYAVGHQTDGRHPVFQNFGTFPAAGNHFTAEDYAKIIISIFDTSRISYKRRSDILAPVVRIENSSIFYGPGFEVLPDSNNLIISHGGDKPGYKNLMYYSALKKSGFVMMTNSDRGKSMAEKICRMSVQLDIEPFLKSQYYLGEQYPSAALSLLKVYDESGRASMFSAIEKYKQEKKLNANTLNVLSYYFRFGGDRIISKDLLQYNTSLYPDQSLAYSLLGELYLSMDEYDLGYKNLKKARELNFNLWELEEEDPKEHEKRMAEAERRKAFRSTINPNAATIIQAEDYCAMSRVRVQETTDTAGGQNVAFIDTEDWMDYQVNIPKAGTYSVTFRVASVAGGSQIDFRSDDTTLGKINIPATNGWQNWTSLNTQVSLPEGRHLLRLYVSAGGFNINWMKFSLYSPALQVNVGSK